VRTLLRSPRHPYTIGLLGAMPRLGTRAAGTRTRLAEIPGVVPPPAERGAGCSFAPRCPYADPRCEQRPPLEALRPGHRTACWRSAELFETPEQPR